MPDVMCDIVSNDYNASSIDEIGLTVRARKLVDKANDLGGADNITVALMRI
jgi:serine/threonine protein phosphatase PrpC